MVLQSSVGDDQLLLLQQTLQSLVDSLDFHHSSVLRFRYSLERRLTRCQKRLSRFGAQLAGLPQELKQSDAVLNLNKAIENCETMLRSRYESDWLPQFQRLREEALAFGEQLYELHQSLVRPRLGRLGNRHRLQWGRKLFHVFNGFFGLWLYGYSGVGTTKATLVLGFFLGLALCTEVARRCSSRVNDWICQRMGGIMRERERKSVTSATWFMFSVMVIFLLFPRETAILSLLYVTLGDAVAGIVGTLWGRHRLNIHTSWEGFCAALLVCAAGTALFARFWLAPFQLQGMRLMLFSVLGGVIAALAESCFKKFDDNLVIPFFSAPLLCVMVFFFR